MLQDQLSARAECKPCFLQIRFFHKFGAMSAPVTDTEKLIWAVLEAERPTLRFSRTVLLLSCFDMLKIGGAIYLIMLVSAVNCMRNLLPRQTPISSKSIKVLFYLI